MDMGRLSLAASLPRHLHNESSAVSSRLLIHRSTVLFTYYSTAHWHRFPDGALRRGLLERRFSNCAADFTVLTPYDLAACPRVLIIARNPHSHPPPFPVKTPPPTKKLFCSLLTSMGWRLADATPRKILIDSGFMAGLRSVLKWEREHDPSLSDLHPSLGNLDHVRRIIDHVRQEIYPEGTGFEGALRKSLEYDQLRTQNLTLIGAQLLARIQKNPEYRNPYVRCAELHTLGDGTLFYLVICMSEKMALYLMRSKFISIDTSFKRLHHNWQEFEIESWDSDAMRCKSI